MQAQTNLSKITCTVDANVVDELDKALNDLHIPEVYVQRAKQVSLLDHAGFLGLRPTTTLEENRALFYRFYVPKNFESSVMRRIADAADLYLPGHGSVYARDVSLLRHTPLKFDMERLTALADSNTEAVAENHFLFICIVQRGMASSIATTILEMGLCVPLISFGTGIGIRDRLRLLRITISAEKEVMYLLVPRGDVELVENIIRHKARLDLPGQGFLYEINIRAVAVNLRVRRGKRAYAATMDQVIAAMDQMKGSSEWRRMGESRNYETRKSNVKKFTCVSVVADEGSLDPFSRAAMDAGASGATLIPLELHFYSGGKNEDHSASHAKESYDIIIPTSIQDAVMKAVDKESFFGQEGRMIELTPVEQVVTSARGKKEDERKKEKTSV
ncbi:MAG: hypothetical protein LBC46_04290 [Treponema sp.]|jgi:hypothetical protein|nr:hypothetical protein [Treponema sp.]